LRLNAHRPVLFKPSLVSSVIYAEESEKIASESVPGLLLL
jgi:hypothetical protein